VALPHIFSCDTDGAIPTAAESPTKISAYLISRCQICRAAPLREHNTSDHTKLFKDHRFIPNKNNPRAKPSSDSARGLYSLYNERGILPMRRLMQFGV
jgi:hypothetical protein